MPALCGHLQARHRFPLVELQPDTLHSPTQAIICMTAALGVVTVSPPCVVADERARAVAVIAAQVAKDSRADTHMTVGLVLYALVPVQLATVVLKGETVGNVPQEEISSFSSQQPHRLFNCVTYRERVALCGFVKRNLNK
jgi:hypothetical protein